MGTTAASADCQGRSVLIIANTSWYVFNFRAGLIQALQRAGYEVTAAAPRDEYSIRLEAMGVIYQNLNIKNRGTNPFLDLLTIWDIGHILRRVRPLCVLTYTPKPNIYAAIAA